MKVVKCLYCNGNKLNYVTHRSDGIDILRCGNCHIMMVSQISDNTEQLYTADYFEKSEDTKSGYTSYLSAPAANLIGKYAFSRLFAREAGRHLDLGCADGSLIEIFLSEGFLSGGLEISKDAVAIANTKGLDVQFSHLHGFPKGMPKSTVITAFDLLEHADRPKSVLTEVYKNLEDNGYFVFSTLAVTKEDPSDYWFNHSLEHYIYYDKENLTKALTGVFGPNNFSFIQIEINGVSEFWGFAKKGTLDGEDTYIERIGRGAFDESDAASSWLTSLFYNQLSKFRESEKIIEYFKNQWSPSDFTKAAFFNQYFQGNFERALIIAKEGTNFMPANSSVYWQALSFVEAEFSRIRQSDIKTEYNREIISLRDQVFRVKNDLYLLKNSRVLGKVIKVRDRVGVVRGKLGVNRVQNLPRAVLHQTRVVVAPFIPASARKSIKRSYKSARQNIGHGSSTQSVKVILNTNLKIKKNTPLLSVVIPFYNRGDTISETLLSLKKQTFQNFEIILVNDGSTDKSSLLKLQKLKQDYPTVRFIDQNNAGVASARNTGIAKTTGRYVMCLDSDDMVNETYIEKALILLEASPETALVTCHKDMFGVTNEIYKNSLYDPYDLYGNNMVITASVFRKSAWEASGGYKSKIGYEDWEFWLNIAEHGFWGKLIPEVLFKYRTALESRYVEDKDVHWNNVEVIHALHTDYKKNIKKLVNVKSSKALVTDPSSSLINLNSESNYALQGNTRPNVLVTIPWMTFGGAETLIYNYCRQIKDRYNISFVTGLQSEHEWEYKFREISPRIYHLANLFDTTKYYFEFISNFIETRDIQILHIIHNGFTFEMLPELKRRHPRLKVITTMFNDRVEYFEQSTLYNEEIDMYATDNTKVAKHYEKVLGQKAIIKTIPNGIDCDTEFNADLFDRATLRSELSITDTDVAIFFVGRLSVEKNPQVFIETYSKVIAKNNKNTKFFIIGDGPMREDVEHQIKQLSDSSRIKYLGYQSEIAKYLTAADIFVLPSSIEGFPLSLLEAMAMRAIVVASNVGAIPDVIKDGTNGFIVEPGNSQAISNVILRIVDDNVLMESIKDIARQDVEAKYSSTALGKNYIKMYQDVMK